MNRKILGLCLILLIPFSSVCQTEEKEGISAAIQSGNAQSLSGYFTESIDLTLLDIEDVYSQKQAQVILSKFFIDNVPSSFNLKHEGKSKVEDFYYIGILKTNTGNYRVTFFLKKENDGFNIKQLRIEDDE